MYLPYRYMYIVICCIFLKFSAVLSSSLPESTLKRLIRTTNTSFERLTESKHIHVHKSLSFRYPVFSQRFLARGSMYQHCIRALAPAGWMTEIVTVDFEVGDLKEPEV